MNDLYNIEYLFDPYWLIFMLFLLQIFQQFTGINAIMFYAPVLFNTLGFKDDASLYSAVITGAVNVISTVVSIYTVDKVGRRFLLLEAGVQMFLSQTLIAVILGLKVKDHSSSLHSGYAIFVVILVCTFVSAFAWSWGPLGWLIPSETFPLETRSAGQSVTVCVNLVFTFVTLRRFCRCCVISSGGSSCSSRAGFHVMSVFVLFLVPETEECADRGDDGEGVEAALVVEEVHGRRRRRAQSGGGKWWC